MKHVTQELRVQVQPKGIVHWVWIAAEHVSADSVE